MAWGDAVGAALIGQSVLRDEGTGARDEAAERDELAEARAGRLTGTDRQLYETFRRKGLAPYAALSATGGRDGTLSSSDPLEGFAETFRKPGEVLADRRAWTAATGRSTEREMRESLTEVTATTAAQTPAPPPRQARVSEGDREGRVDDRARELVRSGVGFDEALRRARREIT